MTTTPLVLSDCLYSDVLPAPVAALTSDSRMVLTLTVRRERHWLSLSLMAVALTGAASQQRLGWAADTRWFENRSGLDCT